MRRDGSVSCYFCANIFCDAKQHNFLGNITLVGLALGGLFWGGLGDRLGRRRSLFSAMSVHSLFSGVATFMPTYGTFMTARFCSALG